MKKLTRNQLQGDGGVHRFALRVGDSGLAFHPTGALDAGIDGFIELRDPETNEVKAQYIAAQLKTVQKLAEDTGETFSFRGCYGPLARVNQMIGHEPDPESLSLGRLR